MFITKTHTQGTKTTAHEPRTGQHVKEVNRQLEVIAKKLNPNYKTYAEHRRANTIALMGNFSSLYSRTGKIKNSTVFLIATKFEMFLKKPS